jgi:hypothetical protein
MEHLKVNIYSVIFENICSIIYEKVNICSIIRVPENVAEISIFVLLGK